MSTTGGMRSHSSAWIAAFFVAGMSMAASPASHAEPVSAALDGPGDAAGVAVAFDARPTVPVWAAHGGAPGVPPARMPGSGEADGTSGRATQAYEGGSTLLARIPFIPLVEFSVTSECFAVGPDHAATHTDIYTGNYPQNTVTQHTVDVDLNHTERPLPVTYGQSWLAVDLDGDGFEEMVLQRGDSGMGGDGYLDILSAPDWVLRTRIVLPGMKVMFHPVALDVDGDPEIELYLTPSSLGGAAQAMIVDYSPVTSSFYTRSNIAAPAGTGGPTAAADFDDDGRVEFVTGSSGGYHVFEFISGALVDRGAIGLAEGGMWATALRPVPGRTPHAILGYSSFADGYRYHLMRPSGDNTFVLAEVFQAMTGYAGLHSSFALDADCDGVDEFVVSLYPIARFYEWEHTSDAFRELWSLDQTVAGTMLRWGKSDIDRDGVAEWCCVNHNNLFRAYEDQGIPSAIGEEVRPSAVASVVVAPNPFRLGTRVQLLGGSPEARPVSLWDAGGRLMCRWVLSGEAPLAWDGRDRFGRPLPAGAYYLRVEGAGNRAQRIVRIE